MGSYDTLSQGSSPCKIAHGGDDEAHTTPPWFGLASPFDTPLDRDSFSVATSLRNHVCMLEELAQSQRQTSLNVQVGQQPPARIVHELTPGVSQVGEQAPEPCVARRTVLRLDDAIEDSADVERVAHVAANAPCIQTDSDEHHVLYSSGMALQSQPPQPSFHEITNHVLLPNGVEVDAHTQPMRHTFSSIQNTAEHQLVRCGLYSETCTYQRNTTPVITPDSYCGDPSSFATTLLAPPSLNGLDGMPLVLPSGGYSEVTPVSHRLQTHSTSSPLAAPQHVPFTIPRNYHGNELAKPGLGVPTSAPPSGPSPGSPELPSVGSAGHAAGRCKPCAFIYNKGCGNGIVCEFCHLCAPGEKKRRHKEKLAHRRQFK